MINTNGIYKPVLKHEVEQIILPYVIYKVTDADKGNVLWYEVTFKEPTTLDEKARRPFPNDQLARDYIISEITHKESIHK